MVQVACLSCCRMAAGSTSAGTRSVQHLGSVLDRTGLPLCVAFTPACRLWVSHGTDVVKCKWLRGAEPEAAPEHVRQACSCRLGVCDEDRESCHLAAKKAAFGTERMLVWGRDLPVQACPQESSGSAGPPSSGCVDAWSWSGHTHTAVSAPLRERERHTELERQGRERQRETLTD